MDITVNPQDASAFQYVNPSNAPLRTQKAGFWNDPAIRRVLIIGGVVIAVAAIALVIFSIFMRRNETAIDYYYARLSNLITVQAEYGRELNSQQVQKFNAEVRIALNNAKTKFEQMTDSLNFNTESIDSTVATEEALVLDETMRSLDEAKLRGEFDKSYATVFATQIDLIMGSLEIVNTNLSDTVFNEYYIGVKTDLQSIQIQFATFAGI